MINRTLQISERDRWVISIVAAVIKPNTFEEVRKLNRIWDAFGIEGLATALAGKSVDDLGTEPVEVMCEETAFNYLLIQFEPTLAKLNPQAPLKVIASELLALHERLSK